MQSAGRWHAQHSGCTISHVPGPNRTVRPDSCRRSVVFTGTDASRPAVLISMRECERLFRMTARFLQTLKGAFLFFLFCYLLLWLFVYSVFEGFDYSRLFRFMKEAWYGGFDIPTFIQSFALSVSALCTAAFVLILLLPKR